MSNIFWRKLNLCFSSRIVKSSPPPSSSKHESHRTRPHHAPSIFINNFNFLYDHLSSPHHHHHHHHQHSNSVSSAFTTTTTETTETTSASSPVSAETEAYPAGFAAVFASRCLFSSPDHRPRAEDDSDHQVAVSQLISGGVAVMKHLDSPDPYRDFRRSMQEMVEARNLRDMTADREFLHELLFCYLSLNPKHTHKFIISAFADTLVWILSSSEDSTREQD